MAPVLPPQSAANTATCSKSQQPRTSPCRGHDEITKPPPLPPRSASFHGRTATASSPERRQIRRPKTLPDLLSRERSGAGGGASSPDAAAGQRLPAKVLVNVTVQRSPGPVQVMAAADWSVGDLVAAAAQLYAKQGRRPPLPTAEPSAFGLHYSQFSLECLDPKNKLSELGSRNFFLCLKPSPASETAAATSSSAAGSCSRQAEEGTKMGISWFSFMDFLP